MNSLHGADSRAIRDAEPLGLRLSVVIITWRRPVWVDKCLAALDELDQRPQEVLVVDASEDRDTEFVVAKFPWATHHCFPGGAGHMTTARNEGLRLASGDVIAFLDDDTEVRSGWMSALLDVFADATVDAVAGRTCNGQPGEERDGVDEIGLLLPDGRLTGNFAADPGEIVDVDHGIGSNMSFRAETLRQLGGFRDDFGGTALREDADMFLRITLFGGRAVFAPKAIADHRGAPHIRGRRFDWRYLFWGVHNHALLLARNLGFGSPILWKWCARAVADAWRGARRGRSVPKVALVVFAVIGGLATSLRSSRWRPANPCRVRATR